MSGSTPGEQSIPYLFEFIHQLVEEAQAGLIDLGGFTEVLDLG